MHNCEKCNKKVKNGFKMCYACNDLKSDSESEIITPPFKPYIKDPIPRAVKNCLWINYFNTSRVGICACCKREPITINNFHAGHIKSEKEGGSTTLDNLAPICPLCNSSMSTMHMEEFISKYNLHYGLQKNN
jgi:hypothetical protein